MKTILVHIEGDDGQEARLNAAFDLARAAGGHLVCLSVMPYAAYALGDPAMGAFPVTTLIDAVEARRKEERTAVEARLNREGVSWEWQSADGDSSDRLVEYARLADVVVMLWRVRDVALRGPLMRALAAAGRQSLYVFCVGLFLSYGVAVLFRLHGC